VGYSICQNFVMRLRQLADHERYFGSWRMRNHRRLSPKDHPAAERKSQDQGESEGTAVNKDAGKTKDTRLRWYRVAAAGVLLLLALGLVVWLFVRPPDSFAATASIVVAAAVIFGVGAVCLPLGLRYRLGTFAIVAGTFAGIMAAILAIPGGTALPSGSDGPNGPAAPSSPPSPASPSLDESDPFTWSLNFHATAYCEGFVVKIRCSSPLQKETN
jgi:hypothetical protein